ncbi:hypothetical protein OH76DRAFT_1424304, partial [Lentinus brumalis]
MPAIAEQVKNALETWKATPVRYGDIPYGAAVASIGTSTALVEFRKDGTDRWTLYDLKTDLVAVLSFAAVFAVADDYETGNYVPRGQITPPGVRPERSANYKCAYSYVFDSSNDRDLYHHQKALEAQMRCVPGFNVRNLPRQDWQTGDNPKYMNRY